MTENVVLITTKHKHKTTKVTLKYMRWLSVVAAVSVQGSLAKLSDMWINSVPRVPCSTCICF